MPGQGGLSGAEQRQALAVRHAVEGAGGLEACALVTAAGKSQLQRCTSPHHPDSITIRDAIAIESVSHDRPGHPHILRMMAQALGYVVVRLPEALDDPDGLLLAFTRLTKEHGEVAERIAESLRIGSPGDERIVRVEALGALAELQDVEERCAELRLILQRLAGLSPEAVDGVLSGKRKPRRPA